MSGNLMSWGEGWGGVKVISSIAQSNQKGVGSFPIYFSGKTYLKHL
jgi:hypothetical protein